MPRAHGPDDRPSRVLRCVRRAVLIEPGELGTALLAAAYFFLLLASYSVLRPIRDEMGVSVRADPHARRWCRLGEGGRWGA
jgi:ATP/ADP translocase